MSKLLDSSVSQAENGSWTFQCPGVTGSLCGEPGGLPFSSSGWPTKKIAQARGSQHFAEHKGEGVTPSLEEFRAEHGLVPHPEDDSRAVALEDLP